jgi:hypothetical protein
MLRHVAAYQDASLPSKALRSGDTAGGAAASPRFRSITSSPINALRDIGLLLARSFSRRDRRLFLRKARLALTTVTQRSPTVADGMQIDPVCSSRRGEHSALYFDLTDILSRLYVRRKAGATMHDSDDLVDSTNVLYT